MSAPKDPTRYAEYIGRLRASHLGKPSPRKNGRDKDCPICGKSFYVPKCHDFVKTCSKACGHIHKRVITKHHPIAPRETRTCLGCGTQHEHTVADKKGRKFCNHACYLAFITRDVKYPDKQRFQGAAWAKARRTALRRDAGRCLLCGGPGVEVHHKVPYSITADDEPKNLASLCASCHLKIHNIIRAAKENKNPYRPVASDEPGILLMLEKAHTLPTEVCWLYGD